LCVGTSRKLGSVPWAELSHNNSYQESLKMTPFEVLYECRCRTPLYWLEPGEKAIFGPDLVKEAEATIRCIQENLKVAKSCQETYANKRRRPLEFKVGDHVYLRVSPMKGVKRFGVNGKLGPRYIGLFSILEKCEFVAYKLDLPPSLAGVHDIFHVSQLKRCLKAPMAVVLPEVTPLETDTINAPTICCLVRRQAAKNFQCATVTFHLRRCRLLFCHRPELPPLQSCRPKLPARQSCPRLCFRLAPIVAPIRVLPRAAAWHRPQPLTPASVLAQPLTLVPMLPQSPTPVPVLTRPPTLTHVLP
jgi:hypothetical protein